MFPMQLSFKALESFLSRSSLLIAKKRSCLEPGFVDLSLFISDNEKYFNTPNCEKGDRGYLNVA